MSEACSEDGTFFILFLAIYLFGSLCSHGPQDLQCRMQAPGHTGSVAAQAQWPQGIGDFSSLTKMEPGSACTGQWILNHWSTQGSPSSYFTKIVVQLTKLIGGSCVCVDETVGSRSLASWVLDTFNLHDPERVIYLLGALVSPVCKRRMKFLTSFLRLLHLCG